MRIRRIILLFVLMVTGLWCAAEYVLRSAALTAYVLPRVAARWLADMPVRDLVIGRQDCDWDGVCEWKAVTVHSRLAGRDLELKLDYLRISGLRGLMNADKSLTVTVNGLQVTWLPGRMADVNGQVVVKITPEGFRYLGALRADTVRWDKIALDDLSLQFLGDGDKLRLTDVQAAAYGGFVGGSGLLSRVGQKYEFDLKLDNIDIARLGELNADLPRQFSGHLSGVFNVSGAGRKIESLGADLRMPPGSAFNASLLSTLAGYVPNAVQKMYLEGLAKAGQMLAVENFSVRIESVTSDQLTAEAHLASRAASLNINLTNDIRTDGSWDSLLQAWQMLVQ